MRVIRTYRPVYDTDGTVTLWDAFDAQGRWLGSRRLLRFWWGQRA